MSNDFKVACFALADTSETTLLTASGSSIFIVSSIIICNVTSGTDSTITLTLTDTSQTTDFKILNAEPIKRTISREVLFRPLVLENLDILKCTAAAGNIYEVIISYLDRNRN